MRKKKQKIRKAIPTFSSEDQERHFWAEHDVTDYFEWDSAVRPNLPELKPSSVSISVRLPLSMLEELKQLANKQDVPYQSLMKVYLAERIKRERARKAS